MVKKKTTQKEPKKIDKRRKNARNYAGEVIDSEEIGIISKQEKMKKGTITTQGSQELEETPKQEEEEEQPEEKGGFFKNLLKEKTTPLYKCESCQTETDEDMIAFKTIPELEAHMFEIHGIRAIPEDLETWMIEVPNSKAKKIIKGVAEAMEKLKSEEVIQEKRFNLAMGNPEEQDPEKVIKETMIPKTNEIYRKTILGITDPEALKKEEQDEESVYTESIANGCIDVTMMKRFPAHQEVITALSTLKKFM